MTTAVLRAAVALAVFVVLPFLCPPASAQVPEPPYRNLRVLPQNITRAELIETMRWFSFGLGARCEACHVGPPGGAIAEFDYAADDKPLKLKAREMLRMVNDINDRQLAAMPDRTADGPRVACITCHRGQLRPLILEDTLTRVAAASSAAAAVTEYRTLRDRHLGDGTYDFGPQPLMNVADRLAPADTAGAIALLRLAAEFHPRHLSTHRRLASLLLATGDQEGALFSAVRALELSPQDPGARRLLDRVMGR
jgi:hypothetical protein